MHCGVRQTVAEVSVTVLGLQSRSGTETCLIGLAIHSRIQSFTRSSSHKNSTSFYCVHLLCTRHSLSAGDIRTDIGCLYLHGVFKLVGESVMKQ